MIKFARAITFQVILKGWCCVTANNNYGGTCYNTCAHAQLDNFCCNAMEIWDGDYKANFLRSGIAQFFQHCQDIVTLIFHRCCRSSAAVTPVKYERDFTNLGGTFKRSKKHLTEKLPNGVLVTPIPERNMTSVRTGEKLIPYFKNGFIQCNLVTLCPIIDLSQNEI